MSEIPQTIDTSSHQKVVLNNNTTNLLGLDRAGLEDFFETIGEKKFRATQVMKWIHQLGITDFQQMNNLSKDLRTQSGGKAVVYKIDMLPKIRYPKTALASGCCNYTMVIISKRFLFQKMTAVLYAFHHRWVVPWIVVFVLPDVRVLTVTGLRPKSSNRSGWQHINGKKKKSPAVKLPMW